MLRLHYIVRLALLICIGGTTACNGCAAARAQKPPQDLLCQGIAPLDAGHRSCGGIGLPCCDDYCDENLLSEQHLPPDRHRRRL